MKIKIQRIKMCRLPLEKGSYLLYWCERAVTNGDHEIPGVTMGGALLKGSEEEAQWRWWGQWTRRPGCGWGCLQGDQVTQDDGRTWSGGENYQPGTKVTNKGRVSSLNSVFLANRFVSLSLSVLMCKWGSYEFPLSVLTFGSLFVFLLSQHIYIFFT